MKVASLHLIKKEIQASTENIAYSYSKLKNQTFGKDCTPVLTVPLITVVLLVPLQDAVFDFVCSAVCVLLHTCNVVLLSHSVEALK